MSVVGSWFLLVTQEFIIRLIVFCFQSSFDFCFLTAADRRGQLNKSNRNEMVHPGAEPLTRFCSVQRRGFCSTAERIGCFCKEKQATRTFVSLQFIAFELKDNKDKRSHSGKEKLKIASQHPNVFTDWFWWFLCAWRPADPRRCTPTPRRDTSENSPGCPQRSLSPTRWSSEPGRGPAAGSPPPQSKRRACGRSCPIAASSCWRWRWRRGARLGLKGEGVGSESGW